jgi:hypothetical protein
MTATGSKIKAAELVEDFSLYPRSQVDGAHVAGMVHFLDAGNELPPPIVDADSLRIVDGFHRKRAQIRAFGDDVEIEVEMRKYASEKDMYLDAMMLNSRHGKGITGAEQTGAILKAKAFRISADAIAASLGITQERVAAIMGTKVAMVRTTSPMRQGVTEIGRMIPLKRSVRHLAGTTITDRQAEAMDGWPGQEQALLIRQLCSIIETNSIDRRNPKVIEGLKALRNALDEMEL